MPDDFAISSSEKYRTAGELIERSRPNVTYYILLLISAVIVGAGLLLDNASIVVGGMLVAPVLTPLLAIALGLSLGEFGIIKDTSILLVKSFLIIMISSFMMSIILGSGQASFSLEDDTRTAILYFIIALASGVAATFAWARKEISEILPGVSIAVSLVPPISLVGIWLSRFDFNSAHFYLSIFILNLFGILIGSLVVFVLLKFHKASTLIHKKIIETAPPQKNDKADAGVEKKS